MTREPPTPKQRPIPSPIRVRHVQEEDLDSLANPEATETGSRLGLTLTGVRAAQGIDALRRTLREPPEEAKECGTGRTSMAHERRGLALRDERMLAHRPEVQDPFLPGRLERRLREMLRGLELMWIYPEHPGRLTAIRQLLDAKPMAGVSFVGGRAATREELACPHTTADLDWKAAQGISRSRRPSRGFSCLPQTGSIRL
jgi:hypothetical protein